MRSNRKPDSSTRKRASSSPSPRSAEDDWRLAVLAQARTLILNADPEVFEEIKWRKPSNAMRGVPVWSHPSCGIICTGEMYKNAVKFTFAKGASLPDPTGLFNASLAGGTRRAIDVHAGAQLPARPFTALIRAAIAPKSSAPRRAPSGKSSPPRPPSRAASAPALLSGGNPQIPKGYGDAPVQAYIAAMPDWKRAVGRRLDDLITAAAPSVRKAVKWNSPLYGGPGEGWALSFHCFDKYVKVAFFRGASLQPLPPGTSRQKDVRYLDVYPDGWGDPRRFDDRQFTSWVRQALALPGQQM